MQCCNPYDLSNPDSLLSINLCENSIFSYSINEEEPPIYLNEIIKTLKNGKKEAATYDLVVSNNTTIPIDGDFFYDHKLQGEFSLKKRNADSNPINIDEIYEDLKINNKVFKPNLIPEVIFQNIFKGKNNLKYSANFFVELWHRFLYHAIVGICRSEHNLFVRSFLPYLSPETQIHKDFPFLITNVLTNVISVLFIDKGVFLNEKKIDLAITNCPEWYPFVHLLAELIVRRAVPYESVRLAIGAYRPSVFTEILIKQIVTSFLTVLPYCEVFKICSEVFKDKWLFNAFRIPYNININIQQPDLTQALPYLYIYGIMAQYNEGSMRPEAAIATLSNFGEKSIFDSKRILKTFLDDFIEKVYAKYVYISNDIMYLELTISQEKNILNELSNFLSFFKLFIRNKELMMALLERLHLLLSRRSYLPKGITLLFYSFLWEKGICSTAAFNLWLEELNRNDGATGIMMELNTTMNSFIPFKNSYIERASMPIPEQLKADLNINNNEKGSDVNCGYN